MKFPFLALVLLLILEQETFSEQKRILSEGGHHELYKPSQGLFWVYLVISAGKQKMNFITTIVKRKKEKKLSNMKTIIL